MKNSISLIFQRGFYLLEILVALTLSISLMSLGSRYITKNAENSVNQITAKQLQQVMQAAALYVQDNYANFKENPNHSLLWKDLVDKGYLPVDSYKENNYGQSYQFIIEPDEQQLKLILTTESGREINETSLRQIASLAGPTAGYCSKLSPKKITGNQQSWFIDGVPIKTGHLASLTVINSQEMMDAATFLRRNSVSNHPEYNRMETDLELLEKKSIQLSSDKYSKNWSNFSNTMLEMKQKNSDKEIWTTQIKPAEINLVGTGFGRETYLGNDYIEHKGGSVDKVESIKLDKSGIKTTYKSSLSTTEINRDGLYISDTENSSINKIELIPHFRGNDYPGIIVSGTEKIIKSEHIKAWSGRSEISANWLRVPTYLYRENSIDVNDLAMEICKSYGYQKVHNGVFRHVGRIFLIHRVGYDTFSLFLCARTKPYIILSNKD